MAEQNPTLTPESKDGHPVADRPPTMRPSAAESVLLTDDYDGGSRARKLRILVGSALLLLLLIVLFVPQVFDVHPARDPLRSTWLLFLLSTVSFLAVVVLSFVLLRQLLKLYTERRANILGSKFKTKLVAGALGLSLVPVVCMFIFSRGLINRTLEKWFSRPAESVRDDTREIAELMAGYIRDNADAEALAAAQDSEVRRAVADGNWSRLATIFSSRHTLQGGFAIATSADGRIVASLQLPAGVVDPGALNSPLSAPSITVGGVQYMIAREPVTASHPSTLIEVGMPVPGALTAKMAALKADSQRYQQLSAERRSLARLYTSYLLLLTLVILFAATWFALFLSKMVTLPIQALVTATQEISRGNLAHRIRVRAKDEIRDLVSSFNRMTGELEAGRAQLEASRQELRDANRELDRRRQYTETLLESIPSAVISVHADHSINRINPAVPRLFGDRTQRAQRLEDLFDNESAQQVDKLLRKSERLGPVAAQIEVVVDGGRTFTAAVTAAPIPSELSDEYAGYVLVLEDLSDVLRIQKIAAWREVAQRIAHEIRNPLTPIALSAQRARRRVEKLTSGSKPDGESLEVIQRCATLIESEVQTLQHLVDEFSMFARFPAPKPVVCDLNEVIQRALCVFDGRLDGVQIHTQFAAVPPLLLDEEGMKRVFVNLIDNAADAMRTSPFREITLSTNCSEGVVETVVADTGAGIKPADKERLFLPYFSTKKRGTGLGLAVVMRIVEEHGGSIRVEENQPVGTRFIIELPVTQPVHTAEGVTVA